VTGIVVDASVAIKWISNEELSDQAERLLTAGVSISGPTLVGAEVGNAIWRKSRTGELPSALAADALRRVIDAYDHLVDDGKLLTGALEIALELDHAVYDCLYLSLARQQQMPVMTADTRFLNRVRRTAYARHVIHLSDWIPPA
jgi:predicted nucleic acid-binding protein